MLNGRIYTYDNHKGLGQKILGTFAFIFIITLCLYLFFQVYKFLFYLTPLFILIALIIYPKIVLNHIKMIGLSLKQNVFGGIMEIGLQLIGLPIVSIGLMIKAWAYKKFGQASESFQQNYKSEVEFTPYEDVKNEKLDYTTKAKPDETLSKPNNYDDLFE